ncbi:MAG: cation:proton antiporter [Candidatus Woesearchaeota archaeon]
MDINLTITLIAGIFILLILLLMKYLKQPYAIAYIFAGIILGSKGLGLVTDTALVSQLGSIGIVLLLFFVGMEMSLPKLLSNWKVAIMGTIGQIVLTAIFSILLGNYLGWSIERSILTSFVMVLSSTAVIIKMLQDSNEMETKVGQNALAITIVHDIAVIPMMLILTFFTQAKHQPSGLYLPILGGIIFTAIIIYALNNSFKIPFSNTVRGDHELQVFVAMIFCLAFSAISAATGLSMALGAFVAGIVISSSNDTEWIKNSLESFKVLFLALFFIYIGLLIDIRFIIENYRIVFLWVAFILVINTMIHTGVLMLLKNSWKESIQVAAMLAQAGEFGFLLVAIGLDNGILQLYDYNLAISVIALTLLLSPLWTSTIKNILSIDNRYIANLHNRYVNQLRKRKN